MRTGACCLKGLCVCVGGGAGEEGGGGRQGQRNRLQGQPKGARQCCRRGGHCHYAGQGGPAGCEDDAALAGRSAQRLGLRMRDFAAFLPSSVPHLAPSRNHAPSSTGPRPPSRTHARTDARKPAHLELVLLKHGQRLLPRHHHALELLALLGGLIGGGVSSSVCVLGGEHRQGGRVWAADGAMDEGRGVPAKDKVLHEAAAWRRAAVRERGCPRTRAHASLHASCGEGPLSCPRGSIANAGRRAGACMQSKACRARPMLRPCSCPSSHAARLSPWHNAC